MRQPLFLLFCLCVSCASAQNYQPFNASEKKVFSTYPLATSAYSVAFDSVVYDGTDTLFYNFFDFNLSGVGVPSNCPWWGVPECHPQNEQEWLGSKIKQNGNSFTFYNLSDDSLTFDFSIAIGDTSVFYQDTAQRFNMVYSMNDTINILSYSDSAHYYSIQHTDLSGNAINSTLNGKHIVVSKNAGLINFFEIDSFPQVLRPLQLVSSNIVGGITVMTNETLYDYQPGDEIQYNRSYWANPGAPWLNTEDYTLYKILSRTVTVDSMIYSAARNFFYVDSAWQINDTVTLKYSRFDTISQIPFELHDESVNRLDLVDYCGIPRWTFKRVPDMYFAYCPAENCWGPIDTGGPMPEVEETYVEGIGAYKISEEKFYPPPWNSYSFRREIVYFKKNGIACNTPVVQSVFEHAINTDVKIYPVPSSDKINIESSTAVKSFSAIDINGRIVLTKEVNGKMSIVDVSCLNSGIYSIQLTFGNNSTLNKKIMIVR